MAGDYLAHTMAGDCPDKAFTGEAGVLNGQSGNRSSLADVAEYSYRRSIRLTCRVQVYA